MLFLIKDTFTNGLSLTILDLFFAVALFSGIFVITVKSPVVAILYLILLFGGISGYLFAIQVTYLALAYLLVYVGAVSMLFLFILMLIDVKNSELYQGSSNSLILAVYVSILFLVPLWMLSHATGMEGLEGTVISISSFIAHVYFSISNEIVYVTTALWDGALVQISHIAAIGGVMFTTYASWLIITSLILLLAMVGAIIITIKQNNSSFIHRVLDSEYMVQLSLKSVQYTQLTLIFLGLCGSSLDLINYISTCDILADIFNSSTVTEGTEGTIIVYSEPIKPRPDIIIEVDITITTGPKYPGEIIGPEGTNGPMIVYPGPASAGGTNPSPVNPSPVNPVPSNSTN